MVSALLLFVYNYREADRAGHAAEDALVQMQAAIESNQTPETRASLPTEGTTPEETVPVEESVPGPTALTVANINGYNYIGYLSIPELELELPIMETWSEDRLHIAPCLQSGSPLTDDAVIAGHNYKTHFRPLHHVEAGMEVTFTDMSGYAIAYTVTEVEIVVPTDVSRVLSSDHDLVLYTCTSGGQSRIAAFCDRVRQET